MKTYKIIGGYWDGKTGDEYDSEHYHGFKIGTIVTLGKDQDDYEEDGAYFCTEDGRFQIVGWNHVEEIK